MAGFSDQTEAIITNAVLANKNLSTDLVVASTVTANLWMTLHTADPGDTGTAGVSEGGYAAYTRIAVARSTTGFACSTSAGNASPVATVSFPQVATTTTGTFTYAGIAMTSATTDGQIVAYGALSPSINFSQNVTPQITTGSSFTLD